MNRFLVEQLVALGWPEGAAGLLVETVEIILILLAAYASFLITKRVLIRAVHRLTRRTRSDWDDRLVGQRVFGWLAHLVPAVVVYVLAPAALEMEGVIVWVRRTAEIYGLIAILITTNRILTVGQEIYDEFEIARRAPIRIYVQVFKILLSAGAVIVAVSILTGQSPVLLLSGLGAMTAILLLIARDSIQGFVAGIQLISNDMVRPGDWIEMPKYGADGDVIEIRLHTVKVRNFDKTITTIPTYALIAESFKNWRGMAESGGRRIKRSVHIDLDSVRFCSPEMLAGFRRIKILRNYIGEKESEVADHNRSEAVDDSVLVNGRRLTNLGVFRHYLVNYLRTHPLINNDLTLLVRQLQATEHGVPLEIYAFSSDKNWIRYEAIQADIFDHIFAALPQFGLRAFQRTSAFDVGQAVQQLRPG